MIRLLIVLFSCAIVNNVFAQDSEPPTLPSQMQLADDTRYWFRNFGPGGSCVQCSIGMTGIHCNDNNAAFLLWPSPYGPPEIGGSTPTRVANYCNRRKLQAWNVTGWPNTKTWMLYACRTGRFAAIGAGGSHFQTLYGYVPGDAKPWKVCNNNSPKVIDSYTDTEFERLHLASGAWIVVLQKSGSENPQLIKWWH